MILVADAGSTKIHWGITGNQPGQKIFTTVGINAVTSDELHIREVLTAVSQWLGDRRPSEVHYFGAGCASPAICESLRWEFSPFFPFADITVDSDLLGAAKALLGVRDGVVAILGTGSNSGLYRDGRIVDNVPPLGFILGDEGSGAVIGKKILADVLRGIAPEHIAELVHLSKEEAIRAVYREPAPNRFLADIVKRILIGKSYDDILQDTYLSELFYREIDSFFKNAILRYDCEPGTEIGFVGSLAFYLSGILEDVCRKHDFKLGQVIQSPIENMIDYYEKIK